jgi:ABC-type maltose transport system permease subunit
MGRRPSRGVRLAAAALLALMLPLLVLYAWLPVAAFSRRAVGLRPAEGLTFDHCARLLEPIAGTTLLESLARSFLLSSLYCLLLAAVVPAACALSRLSLPGRRSLLPLMLVLHPFPTLSAGGHISSSAPAGPHHHLGAP